MDCISSCRIIAKCYLALGNYEKAILYYDSTETKYKDKFPLCGIGIMIINANRDKDLFYIYEGMGNFKKAIEISTPYLFDSTMTEFIDSTYKIKYYNALLKLYARNEIVKSIEIALDSLEYKLSTLSKSKDELTSLTSYVTLFNSNLDLLEEQRNGKVHALNFLGFYSKEYLIHRVKTSVGYNLFMKTE